MRFMTNLFVIAKRQAFAILFVFDVPTLTFNTQEMQRNVKRTGRFHLITHTIALTSF